jgi:hypothetical protein
VISFSNIVPRVVPCSFSCHIYVHCSRPAVPPNETEHLRTRKELAQAKWTLKQVHSFHLTIRIEEPDSGLNSVRSEQ